MIDAIIPVWKPIDWTSFDVVKKIRGQIKPAKVGHAGTLDPFAEGVLMLCTGKYTKSVESFMDKEKEYIAEIQLGVETETLDPTGEIVKTASTPTLSEKLIKDVLNKFIGENTLFNQEWIIEPKKKVKDVIKEFAGKDKFQIKNFLRFKVAEGL